MYSTVINNMYAIYFLRHQHKTPSFPIPKIAIRTALNKKKQLNFQIKLATGP